jgi:hypothetical protein
MAETFPILKEDGVTVPWAVVEPTRAIALRVHGQTLETLARRGGLTRHELGCLLVGLDVFSTPQRAVVKGYESSLPVAGLSETREGEQP